MQRLLVLLGVLWLQSFASACLQDRDTLADEAKGLPDVIQVITGRFPRNPPLFYQMRLQRVAAELKTKPAALDLYDDAGVACDRMGRDDEAIEWMRRKLVYLRRTDAQDKAVREHWYRYYANLGTFLAHRWLRNGANRAQIAQMKAARDNIQQAIKIKPNAHFGREKYQLKAMQWIIAPPDYHGGEHMADFLGLYENIVDFGGQDELKKRGYQDAAKGLCGLITLGNAWESLDIFYELKIVMMLQYKATLVDLANLRLQELMRAGKTSLNPYAPTGRDLESQVTPFTDATLAWYSATDRPEQLKKFYDYARAEADDWQQLRTTYMMQRLQAGRHPDTDKTFWNDWHDAGPPDPAIIHSWWFNHPWAGPLLRNLALPLLLILSLLWRRRQRKVALAALCAGFLWSAAMPARACMWDSDTLANEAQGVPDVVYIITGRFPRNPPLYYEMRLKRVTAELNANPTNLADYDDAAVACERLGRDDAAIAWMERKQALLQQTQAHNVNWREQEYHYLANVGTFWAHRWLRQGADRRNLSEMQQARDYIARAIQLNPNAHFGREKYQLMAMAWIIKPPKFDATVERLPTFLDDTYDEFQDNSKSYHPARTEKGLCGLIVLGAGWESVDIFNALSFAIENAEHRSTVAYLAKLRCMELVDKGHASLLPHTPHSQALKDLLTPQGEPEVEEYNRQQIAVQYKALRAEADSWQAQRTVYMMARLQVGRHPDTDATFWNEWQEPALPAIYMGPSFWEKYGGWVLLVVSVGLPCLLGCALRWWRLRRVRSQGDALGY